MQVFCYLHWDCYFWLCNNCAWSSLSGVQISNWLVQKDIYDELKGLLQYYFNGIVCNTSYLLVGLQLFYAHIFAIIEAWFVEILVSNRIILFNMSHKILLESSLKIIYLFTNILQQFHSPFPWYIYTITFHAYFSATTRSACAVQHTKILGHVHMHTKRLQMKFVTILKAWCK